MKKEKILNRKGFSLVELAIVLIIAGLIMGVGIRSCISGITTARIDKTKDTLDALKVFMEREVCKHNSLSFPIPQNFKTDSWGNTIIIVNATSLKTTSPCLLNSTELTATTPEFTYQNAAIVLISKGKNKSLDSKISKNRIILKSDDIYAIITLNELKTDCCKGKKLEITTPFLPPIVVNATYSTTIAVNGGTGNYTWQISSTIPSLSALLQKRTKSPTTQPYTTINLSCNDTSQIANILNNTSTTKITITVKTKKQKATKTFIVTVIRRK